MHNNKLTNIARVEFAGELESTTKSELIQKIKQKFSHVEDVEFVENPGLIAGIKIIYQDFIYEDSVKSNLLQLRNSQ